MTKSTTIYKQPIDDRIVEKIERRIIVEQQKCKRTNCKRKSLSPKAEKIYKVTITFVQLTEEEAMIKRAIVESIMKKSFMKIEASERR